MLALLARAVDLAADTVADQIRTSILRQQVAGLVDGCARVRPCVEDCGIEGDGHAAVKVANGVRRSGCQDRAARHADVVVRCPETGKGKMLMAGKMDQVRVLLTVDGALGPFVVSVGRYQTAPALVCVTEGRLGMGVLTAGVEHGILRLQFLRPVRDKPPPPLQEPPLAVDVCDKEDVLRRRDVVSGGNVAPPIDVEGETVERVDLGPRAILGEAPTHDGLITRPQRLSKARQVDAVEVARYSQQASHRLPTHDLWEAEKLERQSNSLI